MKISPARTKIGADELQDRPGRPAEEAAPQLLLADIVFFQFGEDFGQHAGLFTDAGQGRQERREGAALSFQGVFEGAAFVQLRGDAPGHGAEMRVAAGRLLAEHVAQRQAGPEIVAQDAAQLDHARQR